MFRHLAQLQWPGAIFQHTRSDLWRPRAERISRRETWASEGRTGKRRAIRTAHPRATHRLDLRITGCGRCRSDLPQSGRTCTSPRNCAGCLRRSSAHADSDARRESRAPPLRNAGRPASGRIRRLLETTRENSAALPRRAHSGLGLRPARVSRQDRGDGAHPRLTTLCAISEHAEGAPYRDRRPSESAVGYSTNSGGSSLPGLQPSSARSSPSEASWTACAEESSPRPARRGTR